MNREAVASFVEQAEEAFAATPSMGKRNTELRVVEPFLSALGWDVRSPAVTAAYSAPNGTTVDYALCPAGAVGAFVATSPAGEDLSVARRDELLAAMRAADVPRGAYTNGRQFVLVALTDDDVERVELALGDLEERFEAVRALSLEAVAAATDDGADAVANALAEADQEAVEAVTETVLDVAREHADGDVDGVAADVRPLARRFLGAVVDGLASEGERVELDASPSDAPASGTDEGGRIRTPTSQAATEVAASTNASDGADGTANAPGEHAGGQAIRSLSAASSAASESSDEEYVLRFFEDGRSVGAVGSASVATAVAQGAQYLLSERGIGPRVQYPYAPSDDDRAFLHRDPVHPDGTAMSAAIDLDGLYVHTGAGIASLQAALEALAERGGLRVMFSGDW